jgi:hypothetical protein
MINIPSSPEACTELRMHSLRQRSQAGSVTLSERANSISVGQDIHYMCSTTNM